ncbi:MAG TPA: hypothetical protein DHN33_06195, partial [Eubacteriaceae bacterium]|nr:hypothetical protein [Eubacteriaceae bacterium]
GGHSLQLHAPAIVSSKRLKEELLSDPAIQQVFSMYHKLDVLINSFGCLTSPKASFLSSGYFREEDIEEIRRSRIEYDIASAIYLDEFGEKRNLEVLDRTVGIQESNYLNTPERIALAGGLEKQKPTYYIARSGYSNILIIDEQIAEYLLKK